MRLIWRTACLLFVCCLLLASVGCNRKDNSYEGRLYYTVKEVGCTRIEWTDVDGQETHHVLGVPPVRDEFSVKEVNKDNNEALAEHSKYVSSPCISSDGQFMACIYGTNPAICIYDLVNHKQEATVKTAGEYRRPCFAGEGRGFLYSRIDDKNRCQMFYQTNAARPKIMYQARLIDSICWCNADKGVYFCDVYPDGYIQVKRMGLEDSEPTIIMEDARNLAFPSLGHDMAFVRGSFLYLYDIFTHKERPIVNEPGITSPSWSPKSIELAYVKDGQIYKVREGQKPVLVGPPGKKVLDVCWSRDIKGK